jgi:hypothetical protein
MVGAVVLTLRNTNKAKRQNMHDQLMRDPDLAIKLKKVKFGEGISGIHYK